MIMNKSAKKFFVETGSGEEKRFVLNEKLSLSFKDDQEAARFLIEVIRAWHMKRGLFCGGGNTWEWKGEGKNQERVVLPEEKWGFSYKTPSTCGGCVSGQKILDKIFGDRHKFNSLPFIKFHGDRQYSFSFELLKHFAESGPEATTKLIEERKREKARKEAEEKAEQERQLNETRLTKLTKRLDKTQISDDLRTKILKYADDASLKIVNPDIAVVQDSRSEWGSSGGIGYYDQIRVFYGNQSSMQEWQWRDRYSASNDKPWLRIDSIGKVKVSEEKGKVIVEVELVNKKYDNRTATFTFDIKKVTTMRKLSADDQVAFSTRVEEEISRIMSELERLWDLKPQMVASYPAEASMPMGTPSYVPYRRPSIKQQEIHAEIGVAAFVTEEQIDHRVSDPQIRYELYVMTGKNKKAERKAEDHGYDKREGGAFLNILEVTSDHIIINTKHGKSTIAL
jgi:hypothetical protein